MCDVILSFNAYETFKPCKGIFWDLFLTHAQILLFFSPLKRRKEVTIFWNEVTVRWNEVTMERCDCNSIRNTGETSKT